jgi:electron transport complex protein RnfB
MIVPIIIMSSMGIVFGLGLAFASRIFRVDVDPKIEKILSALPGSNCGACGKAGCAALAESIAKGDVSLTSCSAGGEEVYFKIADILGTERVSTQKRIARVRCGGGKNAKEKFLYEGVQTCRAAGLIANGHKLCKFGCLGFGDCVAICPFDAIHMGKDGIPVVDTDKCTACGKCLTACPRNIISLEDAGESYYVKCLSRDNMVFVKNSCKAGCIGCRVCEKLSKGAFVIEDNLSRLDYKKASETRALDTCVKKCPTRCIIGPDNREGGA